MKEINATFKKRKQNLLRQRKKNPIIRNGKFVRGSFLNETYEGGHQAKKSGHRLRVFFTVSFCRISTFIKYSSYLGTFCKSRLFHEALISYKTCKGKKVKAHTSQRPRLRPELIPVSSAWSTPRSIATPSPDGMLGLQWTYLCREFVFTRESLPFSCEQQYLIMQTNDTT